MEQNPFLSTYNTPHGTVPFDLIKTEHYKPAIEEGMRAQRCEVDAIVANTAPATFANTVEALERSGQLLHRVTTVFFNQLSANTNDQLEELANELSPMLNEHENDISLNEALFARIKAVYDHRETERLNPEQQKLLAETYDGFVRNGANLSDADKETYRQLTNELSLQTLKFNNNLLKETNDYQLVVTDKEQLDGLPDSALEAAAEAYAASLAQPTAQTGDTNPDNATLADNTAEGWLFTLHAPSYVPFMTYAHNRQLRRTLYMAYNTRCSHSNAQNNMPTVTSLVNLRRQVAQLLGCDTYADYALQHRMAQTPANVYSLLDQLIEAYTPAAQREVAEVEQLAKEMEGGDFELMPWDFSYYSHKLKQQRYDLDNEMLRPYFELERVKQGVFGLATRLYGISFKRNTSIPVYHPDVEAFEVHDADGTFLAVLYTDFHPRASKQSGAWMTSYKEQWIEPDGHNSRPHVSLVMNFTKPTKEKPALLTFEELTTFLHEFGHSLHGMFANTTYQSLSGTNVYWDFVELPSQFMENFATEREFLHTFARHYQTGELIPDELVQRIIDSSNFNAAYACMRQVSFGLLDMAWYTQTSDFDGDVRQFEKTAWQRAQVLPAVPEACMSVQFSHIFSGGYSAGYYSYKWAEVLDADAFALFKEQGIFNPNVAASFRANILSRGGTEHPMTLYRRFRGQEPTIDALLIRNGIKK